jgi:hypothetical protein
MGQVPKGARWRQAFDNSNESLTVPYYLGIMEKFHIPSAL